MLSFSLGVTRTGSIRKNEMVWDVCLASEYIGSRTLSLELAGKSPGERAERRFRDGVKGEVAWCARRVSRGQDGMKAGDWLLPPHRWEEKEKMSST